MKIFVKQGPQKELQATEIDPEYEYDQITLATPNGHYIALIGNEAVVYAVGCFEGSGAYEHALPGYKFISVEKLPVPHEAPEFDGKFWMILFRTYTEKENEDLFVVKENNNGN